MCFSCFGYLCNIHGRSSQCPDAFLPRSIQFQMNSYCVGKKKRFILRSIRLWNIFNTGIGKKAGPRFGEFCPCTCLPLLRSVWLWLLHSRNLAPTFEPRPVEEKRKMKFQIGKRINHSAIQLLLLKGFVLVRNIVVISELHLKGIFSKLGLIAHGEYYTI